MKKNLNIWLLAVLTVLLIAVGVYISDSGARETAETPDPETMVIHPPREEPQKWVTEVPATVQKGQRYEITAKAAIESETAATCKAEPMTVPWTWQEVEYLSRTVWGEARGCSPTEQAAVAWCVLNRVDDARFPDSIAGVVTQPWQFSGYLAENPVEADIARIVTDVLSWWYSGDDTGRVLPREYVFFSGDGQRNYFTTEYQSGMTWDWSLTGLHGKESGLEAQGQSA